MGQPSESVTTVIGGTMGHSAAHNGVHEAARRLSHALAEMVGTLDTDLHYGRADCAGARREMSRKATAVLREWGVA